MCGVAGILRTDGAAADAAAVRRMAQTLHHRGPDDSGVYAQGPVALGHTRLSVLDLSARGGQPMRSEDGRFVLAYNGEIYNFQGLRRILQANGHAFRSRSDTEVVLRAFAEWGMDSFRRLEGMFALALWDGKEQRLTLARDRFGIKPLHYCKTKRGLIFGSEIKAMLASGELPSRMDWAALNEYLHFGSALGESTMFAGVRKLLPGHALTLSAAGMKLAPYACVLNVAPVAEDPSTAAQRCRELLEKAVASRLVSDVPVGLFLSSGLDSSAIAAFASEHYGGRLSTYTASFGPDWPVDESGSARQLAEHFNTDHHELRVSGADAAPVVEQLVRSHDAPFADPAGIPLHLLYAALRGGPRVILQGDGGDELFGGYWRYREALPGRRFRALLSPARWKALLRRPAKKWSGVLGGDWRFYPQVGGLTPMTKPFLADTVAAPALALLAPEARRCLQASDPFRCHREHFQRLRRLDPAQRRMRMDCAIRLPDRHFAKVDRASMAHGVEVRLPMADADLASHALGLPTAYKVQPSVGKVVLRQALRGLLPDAVLQRRKAALLVPLDHWLRTSLAEQLRSVLLDGAAPHARLFDGAVLERLVERHASGLDHSRLLYLLLNLALWMGIYRVTA